MATEQYNTPNNTPVHISELRQKRKERQWNKRVDKGVEMLFFGLGVGYQSIKTVDAVILSFTKPIKPKRIDQRKPLDFLEYRRKKQVL